MNLSKENLEMFQREVFAMSTLQHPSLLKFCGYTTEPPYALLTSFMENGSLFHILEKRPDFLSPTDRTILAYDISRGMEYLHSRGIIHRDLKSLNILIDKNKRGKICDFGFVRIKSSIPMTGLIGTSHWMAPEILLSNPYYDEKVDVYSFGILLWELLTSQQPYKGEDPNKFPILCIEKNLRPIIPENTPIKLKKLIENCWNRDPEIRPSFQQIISLFSDNDYHFPGSETFILLRETGKLGLHSHSTTDPNKIKLKNYIQNRPYSGNGIEISNDSISLLISKLEYFNQNGNIESFKNTINKLKIFSQNNPNEVLFKLSNIILNSSNKCLFTLINLYFDVLDYSKDDDILNNNLISYLINLKDELIIKLTLSRLSNHYPELILSEKLIIELLSFSKININYLRLKALQVLLNHKNKNFKLLSKFIDDLLKFIVRKIPLNLLEELIQFSILIFKDLNQISNSTFQKILTIHQYSLESLKPLINECIKICENRIKN